ncbi:MAG: hypothetical protein KDA84_27335 [Planctomycetaceae bacterium]|nr:hypothetical protein [Planctomycetaceae bacterium]
MSGRLFFITWFLGLMFCPQFGAYADEPARKVIHTQTPVGQVLETIKNSPEREIRTKAREELQRRDVPMVDVVEVLTLDDWLMHPDPIIRYRASAQLIAWKSPVRILTAKNLRVLIAVESRPDLKWMHAVALAEIDSESRSALEILNSIPDNPALRRTMDWNPTIRIPKKRSPNERAISGIPLSVEDYVQLILRLRVGRVTGLPLHPMIADYLSPAPTKISPGFRVQIPRGPIIAQTEPNKAGEESSIGQPVVVNDLLAPNLAPPPPQKIPAHPLIRTQQFGEIIKQAELGSEEALGLLELYWEDFPQTELARRYVPWAFATIHSNYKIAIRVLRHAGPDAQHVAALATAQVNQSFAYPEENVDEYIAILERIDSPGPYTREALKQWRKSHSPKLQMAVIEAMSRSPQMNNLMRETLRTSLISQRPAMRQAALKMLQKLKIENPVTRSWLEEQVLTSEELNRLSDVVSAMKSEAVSVEFQEKVLERIESEESAKIKIELIDLLRNYADPNSEKHQKLSDLKTALIDAHILETRRHLVNDLRFIIRESLEIKQQTQREAIQDLERLNKLLD